MSKEIGLFFVGALILGELGCENTADGHSQTTPDDDDADDDGDADDDDAGSTGDPGEDDESGESAACDEGSERRCVGQLGIESCESGEWVEYDCDDICLEQAGAPALDCDWRNDDSYCICDDDEPDPSGDSGGDTGDDTGPEPLTPYEEDLVGTWSRYHGYDGSYHYITFDGDRTGCRWEEHGASVTDLSTYDGGWQITQELGNYQYDVWAWGIGWDSSVSFTFDYVSDAVWPWDFDSLDYHPAPYRACPSE